MAKNQTEKAKLSMAGEFGVASELCKRGFNASITYGNAKAMDVIIMNPDDNIKTYKTIEVKTSCDKRFVTSFFQKYPSEDTPHPDYWVIVFIDEEQTSHYYVFTHFELAEVQMKRNNMTVWAHSDGCDNILLSDIEDYKEKWDKITL